MRLNGIDSGLACQTLKPAPAAKNSNPLANSLNAPSEVVSVTGPIAGIARKH